MSLADPIDYRRYAILYVDDEEKSLKYFREAFADTFPILTAPNADVGFRLLRENVDRVGVLMTDQRMPGESGVSLLEKARKLEPRILRILVTAYSDLSTAVDAVNSGAVYYYLTKPWDVEALQVTLRRCLEFFAVHVQRDALLKERIGALQGMLMADRAASAAILASGLNHHMRNALTTVKTFLDLAPQKLREELPESAGVRDVEFWEGYHRRAREEMARILAILGRLWEASREKELTFDEVVNPAEVAKEAHQLLAGEFEARQISLRFQFSREMPRARVNRAKISQLFRLLYQDEIGRLAPGSTVIVGGGAARDSEEPAVHLWITDDGSPVPEEQLPHVFDPFFRRGSDPRDQGTNLMACHHIVYLHGGSLVARNDIHGQTAIHVTLPLDPGARPPAASERDLFARISATESAWERMRREGS